MEKKKMIKWAAIAAPIIVMMIIISQPRKKNQEYYNPVLSATAQKKEEAQGRGEYLFVEDKAKENALIQDKTNLPAPEKQKEKSTPENNTATQTSSRPATRKSYAATTSRTSSAPAVSGGWNEDMMGTTDANVKVYKNTQGGTNSGYSSTAKPIPLPQNTYIKVYVRDSYTISSPAEIIAYVVEGDGKYLKTGDEIYGVAAYNNSTSRVRVEFNHAVTSEGTYSLNGMATELNKTPDLLCKINKHTIENVAKGVVNTATQTASGLTPTPAQGITGTLAEGVQMEQSGISAELPKRKQFYLRVL